VTDSFRTVGKRFAFAAVVEAIDKGREWQTHEGGVALRQDAGISQKGFASVSNRSSGTVPEIVPASSKNGPSRANSSQLARSTK